MCGHSNERYSTVLSCGTVILYKVALIFESVDKTLVWDHSNERY